VTDDLTLTIVRSDISSAVTSWDEFDAIALDETLRESKRSKRSASGSSDAVEKTASGTSGVLTETVLASIEVLGLWVSLSPKIDREEIAEFLRSVEREYRRNDYHSAAHAADVVQAVTFILTETGGGVASRCDPLDSFLLLLAAAAHDVGHPGLNNAFLTVTDDPAAVRWNDVSVNENGHLHACLRLIREKGVFSRFSDEEKRGCRATLGRLILSTDMAHHTKLVEEFVDAATNAMEKASTTRSEEEALSDEDDAWGANISSWNDPVVALCYILHCADISNPARPWRMAREWGLRVSEEFYKQGDRERALGVPVAELNDRDCASVSGTAQTTAANQLAFAEYVVVPSLEGLATIAPGAVEVMLNHLSENRKRYASIAAGQIDE
jgi:cAMP-specific phosphodiesterase 4